MLTAELRDLGVPVIWVLHANSRIGGKSDWELFFNTIVADDVREKTLDSLAAERANRLAGARDSTVRRHDPQEPLQRVDSRARRMLERMLRGMGDRHRPDRRHQDQRVLRVRPRATP